MADAWPNLFIVGVGRAGTTSLARYLGGHPDVFMSPVKEPHFFSRAEWGGILVKDEPAYLQLFADSSDERWRGEASVSYFVDEGSPSAIREKCPTSKIVILLREPVERAYSSYWRAVRYGETRTFLAAVEAELADPRAARSNPKHPGYVDPGFYAGRVEAYERAFPSSVQVLFFEELVGDPRREARRVLDFLEIDPGYADRFDIGAHNRARVPRSALARRLVFSDRIRAVAGLIVPERARPYVDRLVLAPGAKPEIEPAARRLLAEVYAPDRVRLEQVLGRAAPW